MPGRPDVVVALDAGGTKLLGGLVTVDGEVLGREQVPTPRADSRCDPGLRELRALAGRLAGLATARGHRVRGVGLGMAEYVHDGELTSAEVFAWDDQPRELLGELLGLPGTAIVAVEADVRCAALAEARARGLGASGSMLYVSWGTGLSSTLVLDGQCLTGSRGEALALGEWPVDTRADPGWTGTLERFASGLGVGERYEARTGRAASGADVARLAGAGHVEAELVVTTAAEAVARAVVSLVQVLDPGVVVLGGGVGAGAGTLPRLVRDLVPSLLTRPDPPAVEPARAGPDAGLLGAGLVAWQVARVTA